MNDLLHVILTRADVPEASVFSADEVVRWPPGALDLLLRSGLLRETAPANGLVCDQCEEACWIEPDIREDPQTGKKIGVFFCTRREDIGRFTVDLERLRQWEVSLPGLAEAVGNTLSRARPAEPILDDRLYLLGTFSLGGESRDFFLLRGLAWPDAPAVFKNAPRLQSARSTAVLVPAILPPRGGWRPPAARVVPLIEVAALDKTGLRLDLEELSLELAGKKSRRTGEATRKAKIAAEKGLLAAVLFKHHGLEMETFNWQPATQKELKKDTGWSQSKVSRTMAKLFGPKPMKKYRNLCSRQGLKGFLKRLDDESLVTEVPYYSTSHPTELEERRFLND
ncbi:MAG TPA: hypothetical protein VM238_02830 [Phycisphaerae bacterium]|nr:hypothetical protein [Phycisphaerae bacterium]